MNNPQILYIDDEPHLRLAASQTFDLAGLTCEVLEHADLALDRIKGGFDGVVVSDIRMPDMDGVTFMEKALALKPDLAVILVTGYGDVALAVECIKNGAYDFLEKPCDPERLLACVRRAIERGRLLRENARLKDRVGTGDVIAKELPGRSVIMKDLRITLKTVAATDADVLITGATGTGKEHAARALHAASARAQKPFVHINCAALPDALIESELFGHEAGAFPGATRARFGKFEHARGGILCLDEIDSLAMPMQGKLLDVLHNRVITRLGSNDPVPLDIRVVALSKTDLVHASEQGLFRADLLYRLNVVSIDLPPLTNRREDIPLLYSLLLQDAADRVDQPVPALQAHELVELSSRDWPGNIRELRNFAERQVLGLNVQAEHTPPKMTLAEQMTIHEKSLISAAIAASGGRLKEAYTALGLSRKTLYDKMQKYDLNREDFVDEQ